MAIPSEWAWPPVEWAGPSVSRTLLYLLSSTVRLMRPRRHRAGQQTWGRYKLIAFVTVILFQFITSV